MIGEYVVSAFGTCLSSEPSHSVQDSVVSVQNPDTQSRTQSSQSRTETGPQLRYNKQDLVHALFHLTELIRFQEQLSETLFRPDELKVSIAKYQYLNY